MSGPILCLDSGTTAVKAAAFRRDGGLLATAETPNRARSRQGERVEQDMRVSRADMMEVLRRCAARIEGRIAAVIVTAQGDGLWPLDAERRPVGQAITWLDGRTRELIDEAERSGVLGRIEAITSARPTSASQTLHLLWLQRHDPARHARIRHALRLKEWLFHCLTGTLMAEPTAVLPTWGDWRTGALSPDIEASLGLSSGIAMLPPLSSPADCAAPLSAAAAAATGVPEGTPVMLGPGDVQATAIGLGVGVVDDVSRCSIFGTSAIHLCHMADPDGMAEKPAGAMIQKFCAGAGHLCFHPSFNGASTFEHIARLTGTEPASGAVAPAWSGIVLHPFLEPGGERAPWTDARAKGAFLGLSATTTPAELAWAGREALAFVARASHDMMDRSEGELALGGGLAADTAFATFLASVLGRTVRRTTAAHAGLSGLGLHAAAMLAGKPAASLAGEWLAANPERIAPPAGEIARYAEAKYRLFTGLVGRIGPLWRDLSALGALAQSINQEGMTN